VVVGGVRRIRRFAAMQIYLDVVFASLLIYLSGAGRSNITFLYFACILAGSSILGRRSGVTVASLATAMLAGMKTLTFLAGHYGWELPWVHPPHDAPLMGISSSVAYLMAQATAYYLVAVLAGGLAHGLKGVRLLNEKILENISNGVLVVDGERRVQSVNQEATRLLGLPEGMSPGGEPLDEVLAFSKNAVVLGKLFKGEQPAISQISLKTTDGRTAPVALTSSLLLEEARKGVGFVVMLIDLTERQRLEEALMRAETMETVGQLAASIAHEIRNPLACIRGSAQEIRSELPADNPSSRLLDLVVNEADRINTIVSDFLHFSKMRCTALTRCELTDVLSDVVTMLEARQTGARVQIAFDADAPVFCLGDVEQLRQVFLNLGLNALDSMPEGGRLEVRIRGGQPVTSAEHDGLRVVVEFTDEGKGMTDEVKAQLFNPFFTTKPRGTGLGLAIVRRIVEAHRGSVEVDSTPGGGSTFRVLLEGCPTPQLQVSHV